MLLAMASSKEKLVNVRLTPKVHEEFKIACELKGASMSSLMHQFIVRTIREEKEREPLAFLNKADELTSNSITYIPLDKKKLSEVQDDETQTTKRRKTG